MTERPANGWAIAALVVAILGGPILGVIFAVVALVKIKGTAQRGRGLAIAALAISALWVAAIAAVIAALLANRGESVRATDLRVGDCIRAVPNGVLPAWVTRVRCDRPHFGEVFAVLPGPGANGCGAQFFKYAPDAPEGPTFRLAVTHSDRGFVCVAVSKHERWSSIRG